MIHLFTVFCKLNKISFSDRQWFEQEAGSLSHTDGVCPVCHAKACLSPFASYTRYLVEWAGGGPVTHAVTVQRYQCSSCGHTHAMLSSALVSYSSYSLRFILVVRGPISCTEPVYRWSVNGQGSPFPPSTAGNLLKYRQEDLERILPDEGIVFRMNWSIQAEGSFRDLKEDMQFRRYVSKRTPNLSSFAVIGSL